jgi:two-component system sensor histidine kinase CpxA
MRSFWIRIFATFWLIEILTITAFVLLAGRTDNAFSLHPLSEKGLLLMAFSAEESYQAGQCNQLMSLFSRFERVYKVTPYLFDETGHAVCRTSVPEAVQQAVLGSHVLGLTHGVSVLHDAKQDQTEEMVAALRLSSSENTPYTFVVETPQVPSWLFRLRSPLTILAAIALSGIITALLAKVLVRPIGKLRSTALELASGNLKARASGIKSQVSNGDEVAALVHDFNRMADQIESLIGTQKQLIRDVSHELRSPLSRLSVALELLREDANEQSLVHVERIEREADRLNRLVGQLLELSRLETMDGARIGKEAVQLEDIVREVVANAEYEASARSCKVRGLAVQATSICANSELLSSAIENVVRNAIRYTRDGTDVIVTLKQEVQESGGMARLTVRDFGPGVPEDKIPSLCMPFYRVDPARSKETGGTGVGLAIADRAVRLHGGTLAVRNHPEGGLEVTVLLPMSKSASRQPPQLAATSSIA